MPAIQQSSGSLPTPANLAKPVVEKVAGQIANKLGYTPGCDLEKIVKDLGGVVKYENWGEEGRDGSLEVTPGQSPHFVIRLASFAGHLRNRFTIAHELGHYFLHSNVGQKEITVAREGSGRVEWEANWFAGAFLLPEVQFKADWEKYGHSIPRIVGVYQVSEAVVEIRLKNLKMQ
jgi:hypothetical protein